MLSAWGCRCRADTNRFEALHTVAVRLDSTRTVAPRTGFYPKGERPGPYQHLAVEFERRLAALHETGEVPDPREAQITRLEEKLEQQRSWIGAKDAEIAGFKAFRQTALSRLAAQHEEVLRLRRLVNERPDNVRALPSRSGSRP
jgi:hypothetical protein